MARERNIGIHPMTQYLEEKEGQKQIADTHDANVTSPGGTAIAALHSMERTGMRAVLMDAVQAATEHSAELGKIISQKMNDGTS